jgi:hypothetical protein
MERKFILVKTANSCHVIPVDQIQRIAPRVDGDNKSAIFLIGDKNTLYSTQTPAEIYDLINNNLLIPAG